MISQTVESWRGYVAASIELLRSLDPERSAVPGQLGLTEEDLEEIILAIIQTESGGNPDIIGDQGRSYGLMQINYESGKLSPDFEYPVLSVSGVTNLVKLSDPSPLQDGPTNIFVGTRYFLIQLEDLRDVNLAVLAYNAPNSTRKYIAGQIATPVNPDYLAKVLGFLEVGADYFAEIAKKKAPGSGSVSSSPGV